MQLKDQVDSIIKKRKDKSKVFQEKREKFLVIQRALEDGFAGLEAKAQEIADSELREHYMSILSGIEKVNTLRQIDDVIRKFDEGIDRFGRDYISIATVGKERQGKSRFLQSVGDLNNSIIPAYDATSCTGATSIIWNDPTMEKGSVRAIVHFRRPEEIVSIVESYISEIDPRWLDNHTVEFNDIKFIDIGRFVIDEGNAKKASALKHLSDIIKNFGAIRSLFGASTITLTDQELIKTYVAQNNGKSETDADLQKYYKYLAVSRVDIYCPFFTDVGRIRLVDTVGIGDTKVGIEDAMLNTVDQESDAAIVVTRPIGGVQRQDQDIYTMLREKFKYRDTKLWLFYLVNHFKGQNDNTVDAFSKDVHEQNWSVANCKIVNAGDPEAVRDEFLLPLLKTFISNIDEIDSGYMREVAAVEKDARDTVVALIKSLPQLQAYNVDVIQNQAALAKGADCFNRMTAALRKRVYELDKEKDEPNNVLWNEVQKIINNLDEIIPTAEEIQKLAESTGSQAGEDVWQTVLHFVRNEITDRFIQIDDVLEAETREFKNSLVAALYNELRALSDGNEDDPQPRDMVEWMKIMTDNVFNSDPMYSQIRKAFDFLYKFQFNTRAQLIQEVRRQLYIINPMSQKYAKPSYNFHPVNCGEPIYFYLTSRMAVIEDELRFHLATLYRTPNLAFYAAADEFYDRITFASNHDGAQLINMSTVWTNFFIEYSTQIWKQNTARYDKVNELIKEFNEMKNYLCECIDIQR